MNHQGINRLFFTFLGSIGLFIPLFSQKENDSIQHYEEVSIRIVHERAESSSKIEKEQIDRLAPHDAGTLLQYVNGVTIKNYGGIGGMKTFSQRGLGGEHNQLLIDGFPSNDPQSGQINFATIQTDNIEKIAVNHLSYHQLIPVSGMVKGSNVQINTFDQSFSKAPFSLRSNLTLGSFGQKEGYLALKQGGKNYFVSASGGIGDYKGDYPFQMSFDSIKKHRKNNRVFHYFLNLGGGLRWATKKASHILSVSAKTNYIDQQLPGAVVLYNELAKETLKTKNSALGLRYQMRQNKLQALAFANYEHKFLHYNDPNYLNMQGFLDNQYKVHSTMVGFHLKYTWRQFAFQAGNDYGYDLLESNRDLETPERHSNTSMLKSSYEHRYFYVDLVLFNQTYFDKNQNLNHGNTYTKFHPQVSIATSDALLRKWQLFAWYKPSSRPPSFNDLYFSQVGNKDLKPEETQQINVGFNYIPTLQKIHLSVQGNVYKNWINNKILALPTKNLFIWSIQNIGKVDVYGADIQANLSLPIQKNWNIETQYGINYQKVLDVSDKNSPSYKHQIAYTPNLTSNALLTVRYKKIGLHLSGLLIGERYSLNENISANLLASYFNLDISGSYQLPLKNKQHLFKIQAGIKNATNANYSYVRYFIMPGINYFIKLSYDFN